ncbi:uncharacterized protein JCM15063_006351 [Sporobolomyces koalae]|uniref:uncharacterized protein n=1 Tax=Sporobolomyces koalae TaxID=500713 RepID=UPI00316EE505
MSLPDLVAATRFGPVQGFTDTHPVAVHSTATLTSEGSCKPVNKWLGIPYAQANRWERPTDPDAWTDPKQCFEFGTMFPQPAGMTEQLLSGIPGFIMRSHIQQSEASHFVNVFAPADLGPDEKVPVMVYVYGGALNTGSSDRYFYDPTTLVRSQQGSSQRCIIVTANYRLNVFGFLASDDLSAQDPLGLSGNYGLYDVVKFLEWVQDNIGSFGGDKDRVTVFGQSAGAFLIAHLLVSGKRLFHRAILQSAAQKTMGMRPVSKAYPGLASILDEISPDHKIPDSASERLHLLRSLSTTDLLNHHASRAGLEAVNLSIEPETATTCIWNESTIDRLTRGDIDPWIESIVTGTTEDEGTVFAHAANLTDPEKFESWISRYEPSTTERVRDKYVGQGQGKPYPAPGTCSLPDLPGSKLLADQIFVNPVWDLANAIKENGRHVWMYRLRSGVETIMQKAPFGILHSMDLPYVFKCDGLWNQDPDCADAKTSNEMSSRWLEFAVTGHPGQGWNEFGKDPEWLVFEAAGSTKHESLQEFERTKIDLVFQDLKQQHESTGDKVLAATTEE